MSWEDDAIRDGVIFQHANDLQPGRLRVRIPFDTHTYLAHNAHGGSILIGGRRDDALEPEVLESVVNQRLSGFSRVALALEGGRNSIEEAKLRSREPVAGETRGRGERGKLLKGVQARHKAACSDELLRVFVFDGTLAIGRLVELGKLRIVQDGLLQPLGTLGQRLHPYGAELSLPQVHIE